MSLEQRCCIQLLSLLHLYGILNPDVIYVPPQIVLFLSIYSSSIINTRAVNRKKYNTVKYENVKYHKSPYYKAAKLWDTLPRNIMDTETINELEK